MEDFILAEINKIGDLIRGLLGRIGLLKVSGQAEQIAAVTKIELAEKLDIDIETLLRSDDFIGVLVNDHGFAPSDLETFAELLADLAAAAEQRQEQMQLAAAACAIYRHQDAHKAPASLNRYYILRELEKYNRQTTNTTK